MRELCGFLFHDADPITEKGNGGIGEGGVGGGGGGRERRAGVVGYNGGLSREMTAADGNRDGGPRDIPQGDRGIIAAILHNTPRSDRGGQRLYALQIITAVLTFHSEAGKLVPSARARARVQPLALEYGERPAERKPYFFKVSYARFSAPRAAPLPPPACRNSATTITIRAVREPQ